LEETLNLSSDRILNDDDLKNLFSTVNLFFIYTIFIFPPTLPPLHHYAAWGGHVTPTPGTELVKHQKKNITVTSKSLQSMKFLMNCISFLRA
jgi:hypothetical protein